MYVLCVHAHMLWHLFQCMFDGGWHFQFCMLHMYQFVILLYMSRYYVCNKFYVTYFANPFRLCTLRLQLPKKIVPEPFVPTRHVSSPVCGKWELTNAFRIRIYHLFEPQYLNMIIGQSVDPETPAETSLAAIAGATKQ